jgi:hypothetical protein
MLWWGEIMTQTTTVTDGETVNQNGDVQAYVSSDAEYSLDELPLS